MFNTKKAMLKCRHADKYKAIRPPKCRCLYCAELWAETKHKDFRYARATEAEIRTEVEISTELGL